MVLSHLSGIMRAGVVDLVARNPEGIPHSCIVEDVAVILSCRDDFKPTFSRRSTVYITKLAIIYCNA